MKIWMYELGKWIKDGHLLLDWENDELLDDFLKRNGYCNCKDQEWGTEFEDHIAFYHDNSLDNYLCYFCNIDKINIFYIPDFVSYLIFKKEYEHILKKQKPNLIQLDYNTYLNPDKIIKIERFCNSNSEYLRFEIEGDESAINKEFEIHVNEKGKKIGGKSIDWLSENFEID